MWDIEVSSSDINHEDIKNVCKTLESNWISMGPKVQEFEKMWAEEIGINYVSAVSSGTAALHLACLCCNFTYGDEVIVPALTFVATANAVKYTGATPVITDIESEHNLILSVESIKKNITSKTKGIIVVHYAGYTYNIEEIYKLAKEHNLYLIEDAAHAITSSYNYKPLGTFGDLSCFSFYPNKNITTGEGGVIATDNKKFYEKIVSLRTHGMTTSTWKRYNSNSSKYDITQLGYNYRMDDLRASLGISQFKKMKNNREYRKSLVNKYRKLLQNYKEITIPFLENITSSSNYIFVIYIKNNVLKNNIITNLNEKKIQTSFHYTPLHEFNYYNLGQSLPIVEKVAKGLITLPLHNQLTINDIKKVCHIIDITIQKWRE
ncbi:DegT/DnrJ/EryC1/StrS aminotransferase family protein [Staphylococcus aureus]|uniref:DegT/DnrJ/EryC1/StrS family aminotransferase n=1 Tax=Staphylococcus aureus TaxID=1280 RepID=UPI000DA54AAD|nr:DegT/DnrJ/EryC1/StrS family aminotransferase [Staphylococcus aureus]SRF58177.1 UDP-4-amino-4-deoxy-L-arabinose--oxoglutarate aminotransferase [Staphylococcus aureus]